VSGLARVLAGRQPPGVYRWESPADAGDIAHAVEHADWRFYLLDTWQVAGKAELLQACADTFGFPDWFGHNLDALADSLSDVRAGDQAGVLVLWDGWAPPARADRRVFDIVLDIFKGRAEVDRAGAFAVLLRGPGPDDTGLELL
jgi:hypothetical protein